MGEQSERQIDRQADRQADRVVDRVKDGPEDFEGHRLADDPTERTHDRVATDASDDFEAHRLVDRVVTGAERVVTDPS